jgi:Family of unknown function (DUF6328)
MQSDKLSVRLKTSLDELRMQVLGAQVLLGFQFQSLFQPAFETASPATRAVVAIGLATICLSLAALLAAPAQHRLVERGDANLRILRIVTRCAEVSLGLLAIALGCDVYVAAAAQGARAPTLGCACVVVFVAVGVWFGVGLLWKRRHVPGGDDMDQRETVELHAKIEQMLTEARVILPGAQAMLGFQLIVTMTDAFGTLIPAVKYVHFSALVAVMLSVILLIAPAAVHRLSFEGRDHARFHRIGSWLVTLALVPLAAGVALDFYVAAWRLSGSTQTAAWSGVGIFSLLTAVWYLWPLSLRAGPSRRKQP